MTEKCLDIITQITVELHKDDTSQQKLGSGVLYTCGQFSGAVYVLTAKHCLSRLKDTDRVSLRVYNPESRGYEYVTPSHQIILRHSTDDAGIIIFNRQELVTINPNLPSVFVVDKNVEYEDAVSKGFPMASLDQTSRTGESALVAINMNYRQEMLTENSFQLTTSDDYSEDTIIGMSGAGIFVEACEELYINGIFIRYSDEERGRIIYAQRLSSFNELLGTEFKKKMPLTYLGHHGLGHKTFENNVNESVANLGPRYCQKVNVKTGTARYFGCVAKTQGYYDRVTRVIDVWLTEKSYRIRKDSPRIGGLESTLKGIRADFGTALAELDRHIEKNIDFTALKKRIDDFSKEIEQVRHGLYSDYSAVTDGSIDLRKEIEADKSRLSEISRDLSSFTSDYEDLKISLANKPYLIINGEAGCGKSHLLGDMASNRIAEGLPTLLFLGTDFAGETYESTIISKTGFKGTFPEFLSSFNQIGKQVGSRALLMIDALNEGNGATLWKTKLSGLISAIAEYPAIGLVVSVRSTYYEDVIPDDVESLCHATIIEHKGFKGLEYEAVRQFCKTYELNLPNVPILTPEFCNPLFLKIICDTLDATGEKNFPKGFNGVTSIFSQYLKTLDKQFEKKKPEYKYRDIVSKAVPSLALPIFEAKNNLLKIDEADSLLQFQFPNCPTLLADLIDNNVLIKTKSQSREEHEDYVVFCYQRISDYVIAGEIVKRYSDWESFVGSISTDAALRNVIVDTYWSNKGILESLAVLVPEKFGHEIIDVIRYIPKKELRNSHYYCLTLISEAQINSLNWRSIESINKEAIRTFLSSKYCQIDAEVWYYKLTELSSIPDHPFNADYFHAMMMSMTMAQRDATFQYFFNGCAGYDEDKCANPLRRLIDWTWMEGVSEKADSESCRLAAIMLCWLLSSTYIKHRDEATKALVNLLLEKVDVLIGTIRSFENVDDMYIYERLYAVAYGVALRTSSRDGLKKLGRYVYETIFKHNNPPTDILLRDHARNIVEYACHKSGLTRVDMKKVRPPYSSTLPIWPTDKDVEDLQIDYETPEYKKERGYEHNLIWESVKGGLADFWHKLAEPVLERFYSISIAEESEFQKAERMFKGEMRKMVKMLSEIKASNILKGHTTSGSDAYRDEVLSLITESIERLMTEEQLRAMNKVMIPFYVKELPLRNHRYSNRFPTGGIRNWLVRRAYGLGFDVKLHGSYDKFAKNWTFNHFEDRIDRIGKKYQWIAFHEIMGILADNYKFDNDYANDGSGGYELYHGTWQFFLRNINPSLIARVKAENSEASDNGEDGEYRKWYEEEKFDNWTYSGTDETWTSMSKDLPDPVGMIQKMDDSGVEWLTLNNSGSWDEPKDIGKEKHQYQLKRHDVAMYVDAILVKEQDRDAAIDSLEKMNLWGKVEIPSDDWQYLVNREKFWSPAYKDVYRGYEDWSDTIEGLDVPFIFTSEKACGHIEGDSSGTISKYSIPCKRLFEGLGMDYDSHDGQYIDEKGNLVALTYGYDQILVKKAPLLRYLEQNGLAILWIVRGQKRIYVSGGMGCLSEHDACGIYYLDGNNNPIGYIKMYKRI